MDGLNSVHWMKSLRIIFDNMSDLENKIDFDEVFLVIPAYNEEKFHLYLQKLSELENNM